MKDRLKEIRGILGKSQRDMAKLIHISYQSWQGYEQGANKPGSEVLESLTRLGFNTNWILTGEGEMRTIMPDTQAIDNCNTAERQACGGGLNVTELIRDLMDIMESDDNGTKVAIAQNIKMFKESVKRKRIIDSAVKTDFKTQESARVKQGGGNG